METAVSRTAKGRRMWSASLFLRASNCDVLCAFAFVRSACVFPAPFAGILQAS